MKHILKFIPNYMENGKNGSFKYEKNNIIKSIMALVLTITIFTSLCSCEYFLGNLDTEEFDVRIEGVSYVFKSNRYAIEYIFDSGNAEDILTIVIPDYLNGYEVDALGLKKFMQKTTVPILCYTAERLYIPWTISYFYPIDVPYHTSEIALKYIISASNAGFNISYAGRYVITRWLYDKHYDEIDENFLSANISFMFNHAENPNEGYFFVDLMEESGTLTKPPYNPRREGYNFLGWYRDEECTVPWNFENDTVEILFDEEGNRIYEEIKIYAGWEEQDDYGEDLKYPENIAFMLNYEEAPNEGYYYTATKLYSGKIKKPIAPGRYGYKLTGWYKDEACTEEWDFETDEITVLFDEDGRRVYEVIKLYAKWEIG